VPCCWCVYRTVINDEAFKNWRTTSSSSSCEQETMDTASFMAAVEADCRERAERRRINEAAADKLKLEGNDAFNVGDYVKAVQLYTEGLTHVKYWTSLYTNRAQAQLRLDNSEVLLDFVFTCKLCYTIVDVNTQCAASSDLFYLRGRLSCLTSADNILTLTELCV